ncbi:MAG: hypothetical protein EPO06_05930 [Burkholderiaceae bacterium]|nr:MAG: hypothetical protein EPO06_05930 [Burkholderiaceae bacterium]
MKFSRPLLLTLTLRSSLAMRRFAAWLALCAIVVHAFAPFAHGALATKDPLQGVFCGSFSADAKLALAQLPPDNPYQLLFKLTQHDCSLCQHADDALTFTSHPDHGLSLPLSPHAQQRVAHTTHVHVQLNLAAAPPPSHGPPSLT